MMEYFISKLKSLMFSRRFWAALSSAVVVLLHENLGIPEDTAQMLVGVALTWIIGDSLQKTRISSE